MAVDQKLRPLCTAYCKEYGTQASFLIQDEHPSGFRHLVVQYEPKDGVVRREFRSGIPADWTEKEIEDLILWPSKANAPYPAWEVSARAHGSPMLLRFWAGERAK